MLFGRAAHTCWPRARRCVSCLRLALALLVARVTANDHDPAVPADDPALVADLLDARLDLHGSALLSRPRRRARAQLLAQPRARTRARKTNC